MPPKNKGKGKGKGKGKDSGAKKGSAKTAPSPIALPIPKLSETSKEFYLIQIKDLEQRLNRYQERCDALEVANGSFAEKFDQMEVDKKEIIELLKRQDREKADEIVGLNDRLTGLHQIKQAEKEQYEGQIHNLRNELDQVREQLTSENLILSGKLASLEEFRMQKEELMAKFAKMENDLREMEEDHKQSLYELEKKQILDKDRMKKDMFVRVDQLVAEFRKVSDKQMAETTKRTIRENVSITAQMSKMSDKTVELIEENDELKSKEKRMANKLKILEHNEKELTKKTLSGQRLINMLTEKCRQQEVSLSIYNHRENDFEDKIKENQTLRDQIEGYKEESNQVKNSLKKTQASLEEIENELMTHKEHNARLEQILKEAADAIKNALSDLSEYEKDEDSMSAQVAQRRTLLQHLLWILNSSAVLGLGPALTELGKQSTTMQKEKTTSEGLKKMVLPPIPPGSKGKESGLAHYSLGDLGFVPRGSQQIPSSVEKMRSVPNQQSGPRKLLYRSIGVQTISSTKALFFAEKMVNQGSRNPIIDMKDFHNIDGRSVATTPAITPRSGISIRNKAC